MQIQTASLVLDELKELEWKISLKDTEKTIGEMSLKKVEDVVQLTLLELEDEHRVEQIVREVIEALSNVVFYRLNARKLRLFCLSNDVLMKEIFEEFGFHFECSKEWTDENLREYRRDFFSLYKEEYVSWLRKQGKALSAEMLHLSRNVFLVVSVVGLVLFGFDLYRGVNTLRTVLYAYVTGMGTAGAFFGAYLVSKRENGQKGGR